jgi:hypothetical protein
MKNTLNFVVTVFEEKEISPGGAEFVRRRFVVDAFRVAGKALDPGEIPTDFPPGDTMEIEAPYLLIVEPGGGYCLFAIDMEGNPLPQKFAKVHITWGGDHSVVCSPNAPARVFQIFGIQDLPYLVVGAALPTVNRPKVARSNKNP